MEHEFELIIARLEILEIEVCNISYKPRDIGNMIFSTSSYPGNIGNLSFSTSSYPGNIGKRIFSTSSYPGNSGSYDPYSVLSWKYQIVRSIYQPYPGNIGNLSLDWGYVGMSLQPLFCCGTTPQGLFFRQNQHFSNFWTCPISGNSTFP